MSVIQRPSGRRTAGIWAAPVTRGTTRPKKREVIAIRVYGIPLKRRYPSSLPVKYEIAEP